MPAFSGDRRHVEAAEGGRREGVGRFAGHHHSTRSTALREIEEDPARRIGVCSKPVSTTRSGLVSRFEKDEGSRFVLS